MYTHAHKQTNIRRYIYERERERERKNLVEEGFGSIAGESPRHPSPVVSSSFSSSFMCDLREGKEGRVRARESERIRLRERHTREIERETQIERARKM